MTKSWKPPWMDISYLTGCLSQGCTILPTQLFLVSNLSTHLCPAVFSLTASLLFASTFSVVGHGETANPQLGAVIIEYPKLKRTHKDDGVQLIQSVFCLILGLPGRGKSHGWMETGLSDNLAFLQPQPTSSRKEVKR